MNPRARYIPGTTLVTMETAKIFQLKVSQMSKKLKIRKEYYTEVSFYGKYNV